MKIFFDTEFTGLRKEAQLISLALVDENNRSFYAEFNDYDKSFYDPWIQENVMDKLTFVRDSYVQYKDDHDGIMCKGSKDYVRCLLEQWLAEYDKVELVSDVCHYDMVLFIDIFGTAFDLPKNVCPSCHDINQDIAEYFNISEREAFDKSRTLMASGSIAYIKEHDAMYDAQVIKIIYEKIHKKD